MTRLLLALLLVAAAPPAVAAGTPAAAPAKAPVRLSAAERAVPVQIPSAERGRWREVYADLRAGRHDSAAATLRALPERALSAHVAAELMLARGPEAAGVTDAAGWFAANTDLPQAERLAARLRSVGVAGLAAVPAPQPLRFAPAGSRAPRPGARDAALEAAVRPLVDAERAEAAEDAWESRAPASTPSGRADAAQRIAWLYYRLGEDAAAMRMGALAGAEGAGEAQALGSWVEGLAAWRADDCARAAAAFDRIAGAYPSDDLAAAGAYWASRAHMACGSPQLVAPRLKAASAYRDSFYGLLARRSLGLEPGIDWSEPDFIKADWNYLSEHGGARRAAALAEIGELGLADRELRHLAAIAEPQRYSAILRLASRLSLPATQLWLASRTRDGSVAPLAARYPAPNWEPSRGWRVDQALVYAHALQESRFVTDAVSHAGARGVMQLMPATAAKLARDMGEAHDPARLKDPAYNIECGQTYLEELRDMIHTGGLLPKVIAAYNAGPGSVQKWNAQLRDNGDPLLFIESIPFKETRAYVEIVLTNYWMYELRDGRRPASMDALAAGLWPRFPGLPGATAVRVERSGMMASATP